MKHLQLEAFKLRKSHDGESFDLIRFAVALVLIMYAVLAAAEHVALSEAAQETGEIRIVKIVCEGEGTSAISVVDSPEAAATPPEKCASAAEALPKGEFQIFDPASDAANVSIVTDVETGVASVNLPPGRYEIVEQGMNGLSPPVTVTVVAGETTNLQSVMYMQSAPVNLCTETLGPAKPGGPDQIVEDGPRLRWSIPLSSAVSTSVIGPIGDDLLAIGMRARNSAAIAVVDTATGALNWCTELEGAPSSPPVVSGGVIVATMSAMVEGNPGITAAFDGASGEELWRFTPGLFGASAGVNLVAGFIFEERSQTLAAVDTDSGQELWRYPPSPGEETMAVLLSSDAVYIAANGYEDGPPTPVVISLDSTTGQERWRSELALQGAARRGMAYADGAIYLSVLSGEGSCCLVALDAETGAERWRSEAIVAELATPLIVDNVVYVGGSSGFVALDAVTGDELWRAISGGGDYSVQSSAVLVNGQVLVIDPLGSGSAGEPDLVGLNAETGAELWRLPLGVQGDQFRMVVADGAVFVAGAELMALELG